MDKSKLDNIREYVINKIMRNPDVMFDMSSRKADDIDLVDIIASLYNVLHEAVTGERYDYMFHWANKIGSAVIENIFDEMPSPETIKQNLQDLVGCWYSEYYCGEEDDDYYRELQKSVDIACDALDEVKKYAESDSNN